MKAFIAPMLGVPVVVFVTQLGKPADGDYQGIEGQTREHVRNISAKRQPPDINSKTPTNNDRAQIPLCGGAAIQEIDRLIDELWNLREFLQREGERVQLKIDEYSETSQSSMQSAKLIGNILGRHLTRAALSAPNAESKSLITNAADPSRELAEPKERRSGTVKPAPANDFPPKGTPDLRDRTMGSAVAVALDVLTKDAPDISKAIRFLQRAQMRYDKNEA
jgi:hypothetical protein